MHDWRETVRQNIYIAAPNLISLKRFWFLFIRIFRDIVSINHLPRLSLLEIVTPVDPALQITA